VRKEILLVTDSSSTHADMIEGHLRSNDQSYLRLDTDKLLENARFSLVYFDGHINGYCRGMDREVELDSIKSVWWFNVEPPSSCFSIDDEDEQKWAVNESLACLITGLSSFDCVYVNHPSNINSAGNKLVQLKLANKFNLRTPSTLLSHNKAEILNFQTKHNLIYKTLSHPTIRKEGKEYAVYTSEIDRKMLEGADNLNTCINLFQEQVIKEVEYRVTVVDDDVFACEIHSQSCEQTSVDWRRYRFSEVPHYPTVLPNEVKNACIEITKELGLLYSTIDLAKDPNGDYWFFELNPNGLWGWIEILTGLQISKAISGLLV